MFSKLVRVTKFVIMSIYIKCYPRLSDWLQGGDHGGMGCHTLRIHESKLLGNTAKSFGKLEKY